MAKANEAKYADYMAETQRDDESVASADLIAAYHQGIDDLRTAVAGMTTEQILSRPIPGKWSTLEVVAHLADTEIYYTDRIERTIALERPLLIGVDERPYPERLNYQAFDLTEQLDLFNALRRHGTRILRSQPSEAWLRVAVHSETGLVTLRQLVFQAVRHVRHHLPFIAEKRAALRG
ncbi:MAG TPA: DinB family protein [Gemmataceae bacterium]|nr:DinB family protein [Gemmataceae bacterium]